VAWSRPWSWADAAKARPVSKGFAPSKATERAYAKQLRSVADQVGRITAKAPDPQEAKRALEAYAATVEPWARQAATNMVRAAARKNDGAWRKAAAQWGIDLRGMLAADISGAVRARIDENVRLITSIPAQAAERVAEMAHGALLDGTRADAIMEKIAAEGDVARGRARVIALTEVSKAGTALTRARAESVGSEGYIWRTARDGQTRPSHRAMEGRFVRWDSPPTLDGMTGHAGEFPNCRCYPEPVVHDPDGQVVGSPLPTSAQEQAAGRRELRSQWERDPKSETVPHVPGLPLPGVDRAEISSEKLGGYSLDPRHPKGKGRVFQAALGMDRRHAADLQRQIMEQLDSLPAVRGPRDEHGERFQVTVPVVGPNGRTVDVTTGWIYQKGAGSMATAPRLVTAYIPR